MKECNNVSQAHDMKIVQEDDCAMRVICNICKNQYTIHKDINKGVPEKRMYAKLFKRDIMQGNDNLFYKIHPEHLKK